MIELIVKELNSAIIISSRKINMLRNEIIAEYPQASSEEVDQILSQYINNLIDTHLFYFSEPYRQPLKTILLTNTVSLNSFEIYASDVLKAGFQLASEQPEFYNELAQWVAEHHIPKYSRQEVMNYILQYREILTTENASSEATDEPVASDSLNQHFPSDPDCEETLTGDGPRHSHKLHRRRRVTPKWMERTIVQNRLLINVSVVFILMLTGICLYSGWARQKEDRTHYGPLPVAKPVIVTRGGRFYAGASERENRILDEPNKVVVGYFRARTANALVEAPIKKLFTRKLRMRVSAYDLSEKSCGKPKSHPQYGITSSGTRATRGRTVAVDPKIIPLGTEVYMTFPDRFECLNGVYVAEDTGGAVKGYKIDLFLGDSSTKEGGSQVKREINAFGVQPSVVYVLKATNNQVDE